ncbi:MAG: FAD-dependent oxidoreductase [Gemmatimonadetes bacterium]|nr:FAD-dependent oxidoreductase [Gemmatimonadota bacterium]
MARLPASPTQRIDPSRPIRFRYWGGEAEGVAGDTVASALYAAGVRVFSRSLKYHRPRGLYGLDGESANTFVAIDGVPNEAAETTLLRPGMAIAAQNVRGSPERDLYGILDRFDGLMPAGFYYRLFHRPARLWPFFQERLRAMAGVGVLQPSGSRERPGRFERYLNAEVAVVGGGPAGMAAALAAAEGGGRVCLFERRLHLGGHLDWRTRLVDGQPLHRRATELAARVAACPNIRVFTHAPVTGVWGENLVTGFLICPEGGIAREYHYECRARSVVVASGCTERPLVFEHNDRPGVMPATTAWRLAASYGVLPGRRAVFAGGDDSSLEAAIELAGYGVEVAAVADARAEGHDPELVAAIGEAGIRFLPGWTAGAARGTNRVTGVELRRIDGGRAEELRCDLLLANAGLQSLIGPLSTLKAQLGYCTRTGMFQPTRLPERAFVAGSMLGLRDVAAIEASGRLAGLEAAAAAGWDAESQIREARDAVRNAPGPAAGCFLACAPGIGRGAKAFVDFDEDGSYKNVVESAQQGFDVPELAKRFGGFGLGPGQYHVPGQNLAMIMAALAGTPLDQLSGTTVRPPLVPPRLATLAGPGLAVHKETPLHDAQAALGAIFRNAGAWHRARYFSTDLSCREEIRNVRANVGVLDSSPLGKFRIYGPDAQKALQRVYVSDMSKTKPGRCKYSAMCNDTGNLMDDGVVVEIGPGDYYFTTSSARAGATVEWFRYHTRHDGWEYQLVNLTDTLGSLNLAGPNARKVLAKITDADLSNAAFPYMGYREIVVGDGVPVRCLRLGFVGELSYELHAPSSYCGYLWDLIMAAGAEFGIRPFGLEAQSCLRAEKGHVIIGTESEQRVTLTDIGMGFLWDSKDTASKKVGAPALRHASGQTDRLKLVGLRIDQAERRPEDGDIVIDGTEVVGYLCTTRMSETLGWQYGLALITDRHAPEGGTVQIYSNPRGTPSVTHGTVVAPHFYDPEGARLRA